MSEQPSLLQFPCDFPIKVMGRAGNDFEFAVVQILRKHIPDLAEGAISRRDSKQNNYSAITIVVEAKSREQLDAIYQDLSACEHILMAL
jgi:putative lipoic acid-binding regulatory protein